LRGFPEATKRDNYKLLERLQTKQEIYNMILQGHTYQKIMEQLHISERTFYRYLDIIFAEEKTFLEDNILVNGRQELKRQYIIARDRLLEQRRDLIEMTKDPNVKGEVKISAHHLAAEIFSAAVIRIYAEGPAVVVRVHTFPRNSLTASGSTGLRLNLSTNKNNNDEVSASSS
jgi:hypothetical protein